MGMDPDTPTGGPFLGSALAPKIEFLEHSHSNATINPNTVEKSHQRSTDQMCRNRQLPQLIEQLP